MASAFLLGKVGAAFNTKGGGRDAQQRKIKENVGKLRKNVHEYEGPFEFLLIVEDDIEGG